MPNRQEAVPEFIKFLEAPRYSGGAAEGLSASGLAQQVSTVEEPDPALTDPLINALVTVEIKRVVFGGYGFGLGQHSPPTFSKSRVVRFRVCTPNPKVLETLIEYTGQNYGYDQAAWRKWCEMRKRALRRQD